MSRDTIAAIATASGKAGVAVIRVSGPESFAIAERLTRSPAVPGRTLVRPVFPSDSSAQPVDTAIVLSFRAPHSYTGEDVVEFQCHGGSVTPRRILHAAFAAGARLARRGEFTERAFLNGRLSFEQAESVLDLINAKTERAADAALLGLSGSAQKRRRAIYDSLLELSSVLEHALDVSEDELPSEFLPDVRSRLASACAAVEAELRRAKEGRILREGALVVLAGPPNAGKSSLMNALLGESRVLVSDVPGTTRDSIEEWLDIGGWPVRLVDTAGLRDTTDAVESEGVARARALVSRADLVIRLHPADRPAAAGDRPHEAAAAVGDRPREAVAAVGDRPHEAGDRPHEAGDRPQKKLLDIQSKCDLSSDTTFPLRVSVRTGDGLDDLRRAIVAALDESVGSETCDGAESGASERDCGCDVLANVREDLAAETDADDIVLLANRVRTAAERLGAFLGTAYSSDLLDALFSRFCVGK